MKVYFMRHGQTNYNVMGLCNDEAATGTSLSRSPRLGPIGDATCAAHLTALGQHQAEQAAERLKRVHLERIIVSEMPRTQQTAAIVNRYHGVPVQVHAAINDIRSGFNNRPVAEYFAATAHDPLRARANGGESLLDYKERALGFIDWLRTQGDRAVLVIAHEETLRVFEAYFRGLPDEELRSLHFGNCEVIEREL